jgi:multidrug resistance efflux pump
MMFVPREVWVTANFKETQLLSVRPGDPVDIRIDTYPHRIFKGHVDSIQAGSGTAFSLLPAENATGNFVKIVQRVPVKIVFDAPPDAQKVLAIQKQAVSVLNNKPRLKMESKGAFTSALISRCRRLFSTQTAGSFT